MSYLSRRNSVHELASRLTKKSLKATICGVRGHKGASGIATNIYKYHGTSSTPFFPSHQGWDNCDRCGVTYVIHRCDANDPCDRLVQSGYLEKDAWT